VPDSGNLEALVATGMAAGDLHVDLGDIHPAGHGAFRLHCTFAGNPPIISAATPIPGLLHRGTEKLLESRDYRSGLMLANRHDWHSAVTSEVTMALAAEALLGMKVPERATWLRTVLCEMSRAMAALSHLMGAATLPGVGVPAAHVAGAQAREAWQFALERMSGGRVHPMITRIGGLAHDAPPNWTADVRRAIDLTAEELPILMRIVESTAHQVALDAGSTDTTPIARLTYDDAVAYGVGGPVARASGLDLDLRRDAPLLAYPLLQDVVTIAVDTAGDAMTRYRILGEQVGLDLHLLNTCLDRLPDGEVNVQLPKVVRAPEGISYARLESATGVNGVLLVSTGETTPWRVRLRTASYANVQSMTAAMPGTPLGALPLALGSFMYVVGDLDH